MNFSFHDVHLENVFTLVVLLLCSLSSSQFPSVLRNCLFRALAEQLDDHHSNLRQKAVQHIRAHSADYAPFLDEDTSFEAYG